MHSFQRHQEPPQTGQPVSWSNEDLRARRELRALRVFNVLGDDISPMEEARRRDQLLPLLATVVATGDRGTVDGEIVDTAVSIGLARVPENDRDRLSILLLASQALAERGEFARLRGLSRDFNAIADNFAQDRPYLALTLKVFALMVWGRNKEAQTQLTEALGLDGAKQPAFRPVRATWEQMADVLISNALRWWIRDRSVERLQEARALALEQSDALLLALSELLLAFCEASLKGAVSSVIPAISPTFRNPQLQRYLDYRGIQTLFPAQMQAIQQGVLAERGCLVAMPTSSGKTFLAELRIVAELTRNPGRRVIYLAPYRLLARQVASEL